MASGDASQHSQELQLSESLLGLLPTPDIQGIGFVESGPVVPEKTPPVPEPEEPATVPGKVNVVPHYTNIDPYRSRALTIHRRKLPESDVRAGRSRSNCKLWKGPSMLLSEMSKLLSCQACESLPVTSLTVHTCLNGHQACGNCFGNGYRTCSVCKTPLEFQNEMVETVLQRLRQVCPQLFPQEGLPRLDSVSVSDKTVEHSSHRPVKCPYLTCKRVVASNGFLAHFEFEHPSVPVVTMTHGTKHAFSLTARCMQDTKPRALAVIEVYLTDPPRYTEMAEQTPRTPSFSVRRDAVICVLLSASVRLGDTGFLVVWCSCLYDAMPLLSYTLQAKTSGGGEAYYDGGMTSLHCSEEPLHVLQGANCLALSPGSFSKNSGGDDVPLHLTFHAR